MAGRKGRTAKLKEALTDPKVPRHIKGWLTQEINDKQRKGRTYIRNPKGYELAHQRGFEAAKGFGYQYSVFQNRDLHRLQHKYDNQGRKNKTPGWFLEKTAAEAQAREKYRTENEIQFSRYQSLPKPGGVKLVIGQAAPTLFGRPTPTSPVSSVEVKGSRITVYFQDGSTASYVTTLSPAELTDLRRGVRCHRKGVSISLELGDGAYNCLLDGLRSDSALRETLFNADMVLGGLAFGIDYFTGEKFMSKVPGYRNHFDVRTELLSLSGISRLGYDKFSTILPHPTFEFNPGLRLIRQGSTIVFEGQELCITTRGVYTDWMGDVYYDDKFEIGAHMFPVLHDCCDASFSSSYALYKQFYPEIGKVAEYARVILLLGLDGHAGRSGDPVYVVEKHVGGVSLTRSSHPSILKHNVALIRAQESLLANKTKTPDSRQAAFMAYTLARSWELTELAANMDTALLLYIYALENLPERHSKVPDIFLRLGTIFSKYAHAISEQTTRLVVDRITEVRDGDAPLHEKLNGLAYEIALEECDDAVLYNLYLDALPPDFSSEGLLSAWCDAVVRDPAFAQSLPPSARRLLGAWQQEPTNVSIIEQLVSTLKQNSGSARFPLVISLFLYMKSVNVHEQRVASAWNGLSGALIDSMTCLGECVDLLRSAPAGTGGRFIPLVYHSLGLAHLVMALDKNLLLADRDFRTSASALAKNEFEEALQAAHSAKGYGESVLSVLPLDGHLTYGRACKVLADIYRAMGNQPYAQEWGLLAEKERVDAQKLQITRVPEIRGRDAPQKPNRNPPNPRRRNSRNCCAVL